MDEHTRQTIIEMLQNGKSIPAEYEEIIFPTTKKEYELKYAGKEREEVILNNTMSAPFQEIKHFGNIQPDEWANMLIFGDNLQALKHLLKLKEEGKLKNSDGTDGVKLVYIDPPFGTGDEYSAKGAKAYSAKLQGAEYLEFLRKRFVLISELLAEDGIFLIRIDYHFGHYIKILSDEILGRDHFENEFIVNRIYKNVFGNSKFIPTSTDSIFAFFKSTRSSYKYVLKMRETTRKAFWRHMDDSAGVRHPRERIVFGKRLFPPNNKHFKYNQDSIAKMIVEKRIRLKCKKCGFVHDDPRERWDGCIKCNSDDPRLEYLVKESTHQNLQSNWTDIPGYSNTMNYPTENSEVLLERIITTCSNEGNIVLDCFAGSGTTGAVAEKLNRKWIMVDSGKLAIYTMQKRMMELKEEIGNKGKPLKHKPFVLYNAGLYHNEKLVKGMQDDQYKDFVLELFGCQKREHKINGLQMHGTLNNRSVMVFDKKDYLTYEFIDDLHGVLGSSIKDTLYLIAPAGIVGFAEDYVEMGNARYTILRIPNSIIEHIKEKNFSRLQQPRSAADINQTIDSVGFDFIYPPNVESNYYMENPVETLIDTQYIIEIEDFEPIQLGTKIVDFKDPKSESLAMVMIDTDYDGDVFKMDKYLFGDEITKSDFKITIDDEVGKKVMIIYLDIFGNEKREILSKSDFKRR